MSAHFLFSTFNECTLSERRFHFLFSLAMCFFMESLANAMENCLLKKTRAIGMEFAC